VIVNKSVNIFSNVDKGSEECELMEPMTPGLAGQRGLRGEILVELKKSQPIAAKELAGKFSVSANAIRRHLKELQAEGLVVYSRVNKGSGAPTFVFELSNDGEALFPTQYGEVLADVLAQLARSGGREVVKQMFAERFREHAERIRSELSEATLEEKVKAVAGLLSDQGFMAAWSTEDDSLKLAEHHCAVRAVAEAFPEICAAEAEFLSDVLQTEVVRDSHIPEGCNSCQYSIRLKSSSAEPTRDAEISESVGTAENV
jgi:DeoR family suf operon transcriptional repressor